MDVEILVQTLRVVEIAGECVEAVEAAGGRVVVSCTQILQTGGVGLFAGVEDRRRGIGRVQAVAVGVVEEDLARGYVAIGLKQCPSAAVAVVEEVVHDGRARVVGLGEYVVAQSVGEFDVARGGRCWSSACLDC